MEVHYELSNEPKINSVYVAPKPPQRGAKMQSVQNLNNDLRELRNGMR